MAELKHARGLSWKNSSHPCPASSARARSILTRIARRGHDSGRAARHLLIVKKQLGLASKEYVGLQDQLDLLFNESAGSKAGSSKLYDKARRALAKRTVLNHLAELHSLLEQVKSAETRGMKRELSGRIRKLTRQLAISLDFAKAMRSGGKVFD